jgi:integrase
MRVSVSVSEAISLGLRAGEILGLSWDAVDFENSVITISSTLVRGKTVNEKGETVYNFKEPKSDTSNRSLPAPLGLMDMLKDYRKRQMELRLRSYGKYDNKYNLVFTQLDGSPMESNSFSRLFKTFLESRGLPHVRFHDLRHTNATIMLASNVSAKVASSRLGHSSIGITMDLYTHVLQNMEVEAAEKLNKIIYG